MRRFIVEIGLCGYGDWEVPQSVIYKLVNQENWWCVIQSENQGEGCWCKPWSLKPQESEAPVADVQRLRAGKMDVSIEEERQGICPSFAFLL